MPRVTSSNHGESRLRLLRVVRRGDRHDPKDLTVSCRLETAADASLDEAAGAVEAGTCVVLVTGNGGGDRATASGRRPCLPRSYAFLLSIRMP